MVTLKNNFGVEPDRDSVVMNVSEGSTNDAKSPISGHPKAILICRRNSHPFQARTLILNTPAKIGRSVARARPSSCNGIFDCKVLSRNHAIIWYEYDTGKFMIQDTKSSNGTFVNNQRLSKGGETSSPREFFSRDLVQFGVDVLENQRKGNEDSENSVESNHLVTHGCIVTTVRLFHPNGKENKCGQPYSTPNPMTPIPQDKICKLELIIHEAQQREERLHDKLEELQLINSKLEASCEEALTNRFEEARLLSKIENLVKQMKVMNKIMSSTTEKSSEKVQAEIQRLFVDIEKVQCVAREVQERQHRKFLENEQKLVETKRVASNLELEVIALREQISLSESHLQEMGTKCTTYSQLLETLRSNFHEQVEITKKLEAKVAKFEIDRNANSSFSDRSIIEDEKAILAWSQNYEESENIDEKDFISNEDKVEWLTKKLNVVADAMCSGLEHISNCIGQLENSLTEVERCKKNLEKLSIRKHELTLQMESAQLPVEENEKTIISDLDGEKHELVKPVILTALGNEKITEIETELKEQEELLSQERVKQKESEGKCSKLRCELDTTIKRCEKLNLESCNLKILLCNHLKVVEESNNSYQQKIIKLEAEKNKLENGQGQKLLEILRDKNKTVEVKETQTSFLELKSSSTNTELVENSDMASNRFEPNSACRKTGKNGEGKPSPWEVFTSDVTSVESSKINNSNTDNSSSIDFTKNNQTNKDLSWPENECTSHGLGVWEKIQIMQALFTPSPPSTDSSFSTAQITEMRKLMNSLAEDLVHLLLRERQISKDKQSLEEKLNKSMSEDSIAALELAMNLRAFMLFSVTAIVAYFVYRTFS